MSDSINPVSLGTAAAVGAVGGAVAPVVKGRISGVIKKHENVDKFVSTAKVKTVSLYENCKNAVKKAAKKVLGQNEEFRLKDTKHPKMKKAYLAVCDFIVDSAKALEENIGAPVMKVVKKPAVAGALIASAGYIAVTKIAEKIQQAKAEAMLRELE